MEHCTEQWFIQTINTFTLYKFQCMPQITCLRSQTIIQFWFSNFLVDCFYWNMLNSTILQIQKELFRNSKTVKKCDYLSIEITLSEGTGSDYI
jgi:hypothetical protein